MEIYVSSLKAAHECVVEHRPYSIVSFADNQRSKPFFLNYDTDKHLVLLFSDISLTKTSVNEKYETECARLIQFLTAHDMRYPLLIHCTFGVSRSTAAAFIALNLYNENKEFEIAQYLREKIPYASPNQSLVAIADQLLGREGRMKAALDFLTTPKMEGAGGFKMVSTDFI